MGQLASQLEKPCAQLPPAPLTLRSCSPALRVINVIRHGNVDDTVQFIITIRKKSQGKYSLDQVFSSFISGEACTLI